MPIGKCRYRAVIAPDSGGEPQNLVYLLRKLVIIMPICPFCRKTVDPSTVWCACGANLSRYPSLPVGNKDIKDWLTRYEPESLNSTYAGGSLLDAARKQVISEQEDDISTGTKTNSEVATARTLIDDFLLACRREELAPTIDIGQLRRDRWNQWKRIPTEFRQHAPMKLFRLTPGYFFETSVVQFKDEFCLALDGSLYKHQLNAADPYPLEEFVGSIPVEKLAEALTTALVWLLKTKQQPGPDAGRDQREPAEKQPVPVEARQTEVATAKRGFKLPFGKRNGTARTEPVSTESVPQATAGDIGEPPKATESRSRFKMPFTKKAVESQVVVPDNGAVATIPDNGIKKTEAPAAEKVVVEAASTRSPAADTTADLTLEKTKS